MKKESAFLIFIIILAILPWGCSKKPSSPPDLSPANWPEGELKKYTKLGLETNLPKPAAPASNGMVAGAFSPLAIRSGVEALKKGGNAADAALTTSLTQVCLLGGSNVSYAGVIFMVYYDAKTGKIYSMHGGWNSVKEDKDPMSIPYPGKPSGRQVLVPGFMAGIEAAHQKFGKLPFATLFDPAIYFAEKGFPVDKALAVRFKTSEKAIARFPETKSIFTKKNGALYQEGDLLKQPALAITLKNFAKHGADYMYRGQWAKNFVKAVQKQGGKMTLKDLENYKIIWSEPSHTRYREYDIYSMGAPGIEGACLIGDFNLLECADIKKYGHYSRSGKALYQYIKINRLTGLFLDYNIETGALNKPFRKHFGDADFSRRFLTDKKRVAQLWKKMQEPSWKDFQRDVHLTFLKESAKVEEYYKNLEKIMKERAEAQKKQKHSDCVVAVDKEGNVAAVLHSINSHYYGFGLTVDGVSISDSGSFLQDSIERSGPGARLTSCGNPSIVLKDKKPFLATSCIGSIHEATSQCILNVLDYGKDPQEAADMPLFYTPGLLPAERNKQTVGEGSFSKEVIEEVRALGQDIKILPPEKIWLQIGGWVGIKIDPKTGKLTGGVTKVLNGIADGY